MTPRQQQVLDYYRDCIVRSGFTPTIRDVAKKIGKAHGRVHDVVGELVAMGHLIRTPGKVRGIELGGVTDVRATPTDVMLAELERRGEVVGGLSVPEKTSFNRADRCCARSGCRVTVPMGHIFCLTDWRAISPATQTELLDAHRAAVRVRTPEAVARYQAAFGAARDEAETLRRRAA
ncbi:hypothetical protein P1X14_18935 [Sphingomonas sp. AOB5]|uniref:LexA family protein n=1 Tax=Sphingomonas sp. AOB5 TaxID=3034017 RepID=UPI0023F79E0A|nr:hypothetical protein [Sphingomonas sp. AOB5]MDF7777341.1 hypothetical protein [Sphingomonas sp. AOB5]